MDWTQIDNSTISIGRYDPNIMDLEYEEQLWDWIVLAIILSLLFGAIIIWAVNQKRKHNREISLESQAKAKQWVSKRN